MARSAANNQPVITTQNSRAEQPTTGAIAAWLQEGSDAARVDKGKPGKEAVMVTEASRASTANEVVRGLAGALAFNYQESTKAPESTRISSFGRG